jgi:hypothetical protein
MFLGTASPTDDMAGEKVITLLGGRWKRLRSYSLSCTIDIHNKETIVTFDSLNSRIQSMVMDG